MKFIYKQNRKFMVSCKRFAVAVRVKTLTSWEESEEEAEHNQPAQANVLNVAAEVEETRAFVSA